MSVRLLRYHNETYLSLDNGKTMLLDSREIREFLKNYANSSFYDSLSSEISESTIAAEGALLAEVHENGNLVICNPTLISEAFGVNDFPYLTTEEYAQKHNRKQGIVLRLCRNGRLEGALQKNDVWLIPENTPYPADARVGTRVPSAPTKKRT